MSGPRNTLEQRNLFLKVATNENLKAIVRDLKGTNVPEILSHLADVIESQQRKTPNTTATYPTEPAYSSTTADEKNDDSHITTLSAEDREKMEHQFLEYLRMIEISEDDIALLVNFPDKIKL